MNSRLKPYLPFIAFVSTLLALDAYFTLQIGLNIFGFHPYQIRIWGANLCFAILLALPILWTKHMRWTYAVLLLVYVWLEGNLIYFRSYGDLLNRWCLGNVSAMDGVWDSLLVFIQATDTALVVVTILWIVITECFFIPRYTLSPAHPRPYKSVVIPLITALLGITPSVITEKGRTPFHPYYADLSMGRVWYAGSFGPIAHLINESIILVRDRNEHAAPVTDEEIRPFLQEQQPPKTQGNMVIIFVESLEASVINMIVDGEEITPSLNQLIQNPHSQYFTLKPQVRQGKSSDAELIYFTGLLPVCHGATAMRYATNTYPSWIADYPAQTKYAAVPTDITAWNQLAFLPHLGFDTCYGEEISDRMMVQHMVQKIHSSPRPFVLFHTTMASHAPFVHYADSSHLALKTIADNNLRNYLKSVNYTDACLADEIAYILTDTCLFQNTRILIVGDHPILDLTAAVPMILYDPVASCTPTTFSPTFQADVYSFMEQLLQLGNHWLGFGMAKPKNDAYWSQAYDLSNRLIQTDYFRQ